jgi:hypothetical protein
MARVTAIAGRPAEGRLGGPKRGPDVGRRAGGQEAQGSAALTVTARRA